MRFYSSCGWVRIAARERFLDCRGTPKEAEPGEPRVIMPFDAERANWLRGAIEL